MRHSLIIAWDRLLPFPFPDDFAVLAESPNEQVVKVGGIAVELPIRAPRHRSGSKLYRLLVISHVGGRLRMVVLDLKPSQTGPSLLSPRMGSCNRRTSTHLFDDRGSRYIIDGARYAPGPVVCDVLRRRRQRLGRNTRDRARNRNGGQE